jgi:hypothetical protein
MAKMRGERCTQDGCDRQVFAREVCRLHYWRLYERYKGTKDDPLRHCHQGRFDRAVSAFERWQMAESEDDARRAYQGLRKAMLSFALAVIIKRRGIGWLNEKGA